MRTIGFDINPEYRDLFESRLSLFENNTLWDYRIHDSRALSELLDECSIEICITSPPYWNILHRPRSADRKQSVSYSTNGNDIGNIEDYNSYLEALKVVSQQVEIVLRPNGYFILNVMDIRKKSTFYPLHQDASDAVVQSGFVLEDIIIWDRQNDYNSMRPLGYPYKFIVNKVHEYLLIFRKRELTHAKKTST